MRDDISRNAFHGDCRMRELQIPQITEFIEYRRNWEERINMISSDRIPKKHNN
jgi:hypothetical protein